MKRKILLLFWAFCFMGGFAQAQSSRDYIKNRISSLGECKSVAITRTNGDAMIYGDNGWSAQGCPVGFTDALHELNENRETIQDINLSESGRWLILYGNNGMRWSSLYTGLENKIREFNNARETITTVTFNDSGDWAVVTTKHISASDRNIQDWLADGCEMYGQLWTVCITDDAAVAVYEEGYKFLGNIPQDLKDALTSCVSDVYVVKMAGTSWFFRATDGYWRYRM